MSAVLGDLPFRVHGVLWVLVNEIFHSLRRVETKAPGSLPALQASYPCSGRKEN